VDSTVKGQSKAEQKLSSDNIISQEIIYPKDRFKRIDANMVDFKKPLFTDVSKGESLGFSVPCHSCGKEGETRMCTTSIPYFKEIIIMAFTCEFCGTHSAEVKVGGEMSEQGRKIVLHVNSDADLQRDLFKSETCSVAIPEIELELATGTLGGIYTTVEGLLDRVSQESLA